MAEITNIVGSIGGAIAILTAIFSVVNLRRQTLLMASQVDKEIEIKITRDLEAPEGVDTKLRTFLNRRLNDVRNQMRLEFNPQLDEINRILRDSHLVDRRDIMEDTLRLLADEKDAVEAAKESSSKVQVLESEIQALQQTVDDIRNGIGNDTMVQAQIRGIAEQLLRMTRRE